MVRSVLALAGNRRGRSEKWCFGRIIFSVTALPVTHGAAVRGLPAASLGSGNG